MLRILEKESGSAALALHSNGDTDLGMRDRMINCLKAMKAPHSPACQDAACMQLLFIQLWHILHHSKARCTKSHRGTQPHWQPASLPVTHLFEAAGLGQVPPGPAGISADRHAINPAGMQG